MNKRGKQILLFSVISIIALVLLSTFAFQIISAGAAPNVTLSIVTITPTINEDTITTINFTITEVNETASNITNITIQLPTGFNFTNLSTSGVASATAYGANFSTAKYGFANTTAFRQHLFFNATTDSPLVRNGTTKYFWFNVTATEPGTYGVMINVSYNSSGGTGNSIWNRTNVTVTVLDITVPTCTQFNSTQKDAVAGNLGGNMSVNINNTMYNFTNVLNFSCRVTDNYNLASVTLFVEGIMAPTYTNSTPEIGAKMYSSVIGLSNQTNFTQVIPQSGTYKWWCQAVDAVGNRKSSNNMTFTVNAFSFSGWVKDKTFTNVSGANVSVYEFVQSQGGPPSQRILTSVTTGAGGNFTVNNINNSYSNMMYKVKVTINDSTGNVTEVGPSLPPMPREALLFSMNGGTFYTQAATTLKLYAWNNITNCSDGNAGGDGADVTKSNNQSAVKFGYEVIDQSLGFPIESNVQGGGTSASVVVPTNRNYTIMFVRDPYTFTSASNLCKGPGHMNETDCPSPPTSISVTYNNMVGLQNTTEIISTSTLVIVNKSLAFAQYNLTGCVNIIGNTTTVNITDIKAKLIPWTGFVPPLKGEVSDFDPTDANSFKLGLSGSGLNNLRGCSLGAFNLTLMGSATGIEWLIEAYSDNESTPKQEHFAAFQNLTMTNADKKFNLTLKKLLGQYSLGSDINTSKVEIIVQDTNNTAPADTHVEVYVKNPVFGTIHYIIETLSGNGKFNLSLINDTTEAEVRVYSNQYAPREQKINLSANSTTVTLYPFRPQKVFANGSIDPSRVSGSGMTIRFMRNSAACNVYTPDVTTCQLGNAKNADFDPLQAMMAGKVNLWMKASPSNITLYFINVDMMASGPPDAAFSENVSGASVGTNTLSQVWKFGSMAPDIYDKVMIGIPYNSSIDESWNQYVNISALYDSDWRVIWNASVNTTTELPSEYSDFSNSFFAGAISCGVSTTSVTSGSCYMNTTNDGDGHAGYFWITLPHFSNTANQVTSSSIPSSTSPEGGVPSPGATTPPEKTYDIGDLTTSATKEVGVGEAVKFKIEDASHTIKLTGLTATSASVKISSIVITKTLQLNKPENVDLDQDGTNEISITLTSVNLATMKATFSISPLVAVPPTAPSVQCGDGVCQTTETCSSCVSDCACKADEECKAGVCQKKGAVTPPAPTPSAAPTISNVWLWTAVLAVVVVVIIIWALLQSKKKK